MHLCRAGCCGSREESVQKAERILSEALIRPMPFPAPNKWTKVSPAVGHNALLGACHNLFPDALRAEFGKLTERGEEDESSDQNKEDEELGVPRNEVKKWRKLARKRNLRAMHFMSDPQSLFVNILWTLVSEPVMDLHGLFFSQATWHSHRVEVKATSRGLMLGRFCDMSRSPAVEAMKKLTLLLERPNEQLDLLVFFFGPLSSWPQARAATVRRAVLTTMGQLARKLVFPFQQYPWRLWPLACAEQESKLRCAEELWSAPCCCLDTSFSQRLRAGANAVEDLLEADAGSFLATVFERVVMSSTFIERKFANFARWLDVKRSPPSLPTLAAKHVTRSFSEAAERWRKRKASGARQADFRSRPAWVKAAAASRRNGWHMFLEELRQRQDGEARSRDDFVAEATVAWGAKSRQEKQRYQLRAKGHNAIERAKAGATHIAAAESNTHGGPWSLCSLAGRWPLEPEALKEATEVDGGFQQSAEAWKQAGWRKEKLLLLSTCDNVAEGQS